MLRPALLAGRRVAVAGPATGPAAGLRPTAAEPHAGPAPAGDDDRVVIERLRALGAWAEPIDAATLADEDATATWVRDRAPLHALVFLAAEPFGAGGGDRLQATLELAWRAARGAQLHAPGSGGRLLFVGPRAGAGPHAEAVRAGLENLARTLSVEWARFRVTAVAVMPGPETAPADAAGLAAFLLSDAGGYFSGCRFSLGEVAPAPRV
jgi:NAD(P)-dependent dehydrogenase (short-subunit alcohol dehydrogenase family)